MYVSTIHDVYTHILQDCFTATGAIISLGQSYDCPSDMIAPVAVKQPWRIWAKSGLPNHNKPQQNVNHVYNRWNVFFNYIYIFFDMHACLHMLVKRLLISEQFLHFPYPSTIHIICDIFLQRMPSPLIQVDVALAIYMYIYISVLMQFPHVLSMCTILEMCSVCISMYVKYIHICISIYIYIHKHALVYVYVVCWRKDYLHHNNFFTLPYTSNIHTVSDIFPQPDAITTYSSWSRVIYLCPDAIPPCNLQVAGGLASRLSPDPQSGMLSGQYATNLVWSWTLINLI